MFDATGRVLYVGKAKRLRTRLLTYFRAEYPNDKAARILYAASEIRWEYVPSEFAAYLGEWRSGEPRGRAVLWSVSVDAPDARSSAYLE